MDRPLGIKSITRLKYRDKNNNNELKDSSTIRIEFISNFLPEFISIWSVRSKVRPFINKVRRCYNCLRWSHSAAFCRGGPAYSRCGKCHDLKMCSNDGFTCPDCKEIHSSFDFSCDIFQKYKIINHIMFCNINQYKAKKFMKIRGITNVIRLNLNLNLRLI